MSFPPCDQRTKWLFSNRYHGPSRVNRLDDSKVVSSGGIGLLTFGSPPKYRPFVIKSLTEYSTLSDFTACCRVRAAVTAGSSAAAVVDVTPTSAAANRGRKYGM